MTLAILSPETVFNPGALRFKSVPRRIVGRVSVQPRADLSVGLVARLVAENQLLRYLLALLPFIIAMILRPDLALPISQAPLAMLVLIGFVELRVLRVPRHKRAAIMSESEALSVLDELAFRGRRILQKIAAGRPRTDGEFHLVVDQSDLAALPPLTVISVQSHGDGPPILELDPSERDMIRRELFDATFTEKRLQLANLRLGECFRTVALDTRSVSAHARLSRLLAVDPEEAAT